ncbi:MAG: FtsW/RodA/SpoVE family cell cycle protein, partial [Dokdonella sp.]
MINAWLEQLRYRSRLVIRKPRVDMPLLGALFLLAMIGVATQYSASDLDRGQAIAQGIRLALGGTLMALISRIPPSTLRNWTPWMFAASVALLVLVALLGEGKGAHRWLDLQFVRFQPSELLKLTMPMMVVWYLHQRPLPPNWTTLSVVCVMIAVPAG